MLFVQYLGLSLQVIFKASLHQFFSSSAWKRDIMPMGQLLRYREFLAGGTDASSTITHMRHKLRHDTFLSGQLVDNLRHAGSKGYKDDEGDDDAYGAHTDLPLKLLHLITTECQLNMVQHGCFTVIATDLEWFGPSLPHATILSILKFIGVPAAWLSFTRSFLRMPLRFHDQELCVRECGTPIGYALSAALGEMVLFVMDYAVNQHADGLFLHRNHDDIWFFDPHATRVVAAWAEMKRYASLAGLTFNASKTGSASVGESAQPELPHGAIHWGLLTLDAARGRFAVNDTELDKHIAELRCQLRAARTVFGTVNCWNKYNSFLVRQLGGRPAFCLGEEHARAIVDALARVQRSLFPRGSGGLVGHLREVIHECFGAHELPEGYFYLPIKTGGLEVKNPLPELFGAKSKMAADKQSFKKAAEDDVVAYKALKEAWEQNTPDVVGRMERGRLPSARGMARAGAPNIRITREDDTEFMSFEEYSQCRETLLPAWGAVYTRMMEICEPDDVEQTPTVKTLLSQSTGDWDGMNFYDRWVVALYGEEVVKRFGSLDPVDRTLIPLGVVKMFTQARMRWDQ
jgi:hypothetical protein